MIHAYARVSTFEQARANATSIPEQIRKCRAIAQLRGVAKFDVVEYRDDGVSGAIPLSHRPAGKQMWADLKPKDVIVAAKLDRMFRSSSDALTTMERLKEKNVDVILIAMGTEPVGQSAVSKLFFEMLAAFADFERSLINERTRDGKRGKFAKNGHLGGEAPYGWRVTGDGKNSMLVPEPTEQEVVAIVMRRWPTKTQAQIVTEINMRGYKTRENKAFGYMQIRRIWEREERRKALEKAA